jgi:RNA-dependent RNA polymerase
MVGRTIQVHGFDLTDSAESAKDILERIAGTGTICAVKLRPPRNISANSRAFAIVQFQTQESASLVEDAARRNALRIGRFYLKARPAERDIIPRPRIPMFSLEDTVLHLGCLVKENILSAFFRASNVSVQFGFDMKKIYFYLSYNLTKYKLELSYESIWEMQLQRPPAYRSRTKFLLIQVGFSYNLPSLGHFSRFFRFYIFNPLKDTEVDDLSYKNELFLILLV